MIKPPYPYFGSKRRITDVVWNYLGDVGLYIEPFAGSLAVLLARPKWHKGRLEVVNDIDCLIVNFWRAMKHDALGTMKWAKDSVNEADLVSRNNWLVKHAGELRGKIFADPDYFDAKIAGWWVWGQSCSIGRGWAQDEAMNRLPKIGPQGIMCEDCNEDYFLTLQSRLEDVRVANGSWERLLTDGVLSHELNSIGVFLDPPYSGEMTKKLYANEGDAISPMVRKWCIERGSSPRFRIVLAGYLDEHGGKMPEGWEEHKYKGTGSFVGRTKEGQERKSDGNRENRHKETLWISPHCRRAAGGLLGATVATTKIKR